MEDLEGKTAFITGGASGIGRAMALSFAGAGMRIAIADIEPGALRDMAAELEGKGAQVLPLEVDVADRAAMEDAAGRTVDAFGGVHVLCNNAGVGVAGPLDEMSDADWDWVLDVNLKGVVNGLQAFLPRIKATGDGGHVVNTASLAGHLAPGGLGAYVTTKFAVVGLSESLRQDMEPHGIGVTVLCPGFVSTQIHKSGRNRPEIHGGPVPASAGTFLAEMIESGIPATVIGERVLQAVRRNEMYIFTHADARERMEARMQQILDVYPKPE